MSARGYALYNICLKLHYFSSYLMAHLATLTPFRTQGVQLVEEDHTGRRIARSLENLSHCSLAFSHILKRKCIGRNIPSMRV